MGDWRAEGKSSQGIFYCPAFSLFPFPTSGSGCVPLLQDPSLHQALVGLFLLFLTFLSQSVWPVIFSLGTKCWYSMLSHFFFFPHSILCFTRGFSYQSFMRY